jgi:hypothetical protein
VRRRRLFAGYKPLTVTTAGARQEPAGPRLADLNPDRMWPVYRRYHLLIVGQRDDEQGLAFAAAVVDVLARFLPASRAMLVRAADARRIGVLIATDQQDVGVMTAASAEALFLSKPPFEDIRDPPLRIIVSFESHVLVCRPNFMARHAYLMAKTFIVLALLLFTFGSRAGAHETIDIDKVNDTVAANDEAAARVTAAHDPGPKGEAQFALGMVLVEVTDVLNRDLAAHSGRLTVNAEPTACARPRPA